jgi:hypothetical protein
MTAVLVLVHSPAVGPATWRPVADHLAATGRDAVVPSLLTITDGGPPYWPRVVDAVAGAVRDPVAGGSVMASSSAGAVRDSSGQAPGARGRAPNDAVGKPEGGGVAGAGDGGRSPGRPLILVAHSNAGLFVPVLAARLGARVVGSVFVDAALPPRSGDVAAAPPEFLGKLRAMAVDGVLPVWTDWWDEADVARLFPDAATRRAVIEEQPRIPLAYYEATVPVPEGWDDRPCAYVYFGPPYDELAEAARSRGWPVHHLPGRHLHQVVDPAGVARLLADVADQISAGRPE